jgi:hypothetical protein
VRTLLRALATLAALLVSAHAASAQGGLRSGFWLEGSTGTGTVRNTCAGCPGITVGYGSSSHVRIGGSLNRRLLVGMELFALRSSKITLASGQPPVEAENISLGPVVIGYVGRSGFFLKGGAGLTRGTYTVRPELGEPVTTERTGSGLTFGVGLDLKLLRWLAMTVTLDTYVAAVGDVYVEDVLVDDIIATMYEAGIGLTLR